MKARIVYAADVLTLGFSIALAFVVLVAANRIPRWPHVVTCGSSDARSPQPGSRVPRGV